MSKSTDDLFENIRDAVIRRDWEKRNGFLLLLLEKVGRQQAMELAVGYAEWYLPRFIEKNPSETWAEIRLGEVRKAMTVGFENANIPEMFPEVRKGFDDPLDRTFQRGAMYSLWAMTRPAANNEKSVEFARDAIATILTIVLYEYREWIPPELMRDDRPPSREELEFGMWFDLVGKIEGILNRSPE